MNTVTIAIVLIVFGARLLSGMGSSAREVEWKPPRWPSEADGSISWSLTALVVSLLLVVSGLYTSVERSIAGAAAFLALVGVLLLLLWPWPLLRRLARAGRPRLAFHVARFLSVFPRTGEVGSGAVLVAGLALAHRGGVTREERLKLWEKLLAEERNLGVFCCACAVMLLLDARAARDAGRADEARETTAAARALLATLEYGSKLAVPRVIRELAAELSALVNASRGDWDSVASLRDDGPLIARALRAYAIERVRRSRPEDETAGDRASAVSPEVRALFARARRSEARDIDAARAAATYVALARGQTVGTSAQLEMLEAFDAMLTPSHARSVLPPSADDELVGMIRDTVAEAIASLLAASPPPIHRLAEPGPVSARVHQRLESTLYEAFSRRAARLVETKESGRRHRAYDEWVEAANARDAFRTLERAFGTPAAAEKWDEHKYAYCLLGVLLSDSAPHRRPLAHTIFKSLHVDATRFGDTESATREAGNCATTLGVD